jgi:predicted transport protein
MAKVIDDAITTMTANLHEKTGKSLDEWVKLAAGSGKGKHGEILAFLKSKYELGHGYANLVARRCLEAASGEEPKGAEDLVEAQFAGTKAALKPLYDLVIAAAKSFGKDIDVDPKKAYVSLRRKKQFALVQPSTAKRLDLGLNLKGVEPKGRLEASGSFNAMCSHRVRLEKPEDFNAEVKGWLKQAYEAS